MLAPLQSLAARQLRDLRSGVRLVVVHPNVPAQHRLVELFGDTLLYVCFHGAALEYEQLLTQFETAAAEQQSLAETDVVLDECDRAQPAALVSFMRRLLDLRPASRIYLLTRSTPSELLRDPELRSLSALIPVDEQSMLWDYIERANHPDPLLEVYALGAGRALVNGKQIENWDGLLPRELFFFMVDRGMVTRQEIFQTFWPTLPIREATNVFHVTKRKINEVLRVDLTVYVSGYYHISPHIQLSYDVSSFNKLLQDALIAGKTEAEAATEAALSLYRNDFLVQSNSEWVKVRRQNLRQTYAEAVAGLARTVAERDEPLIALRLYQRVYAIQRTRQDLVEQLMRLYVKLDMKEDALRCYDNLCVELERAQDGVLEPALKAYAESLRA